MQVDRPLDVSLEEQNSQERFQDLHNHRDYEDSIHVYMVGNGLYEYHDVEHSNDYCNLHLDRRCVDGSILLQGKRLGYQLMQAHV
jgi:hypothetical protein